MGVGRRGTPGERTWGFLLLAVIALGTAATVGVTALAVQEARDGARVRTLNELTTVAAAVDRQVSSYAEALYILRGAFALDPDLSRAEFTQLVDAQDLLRRNPGARAISFNRRVAADELAAFSAARAAELPGFDVRPTGNRTADRYVVDYLEPLASNEAALGFDIVSEQRRREAVEFARDEAELAATAPLTLVQRQDGEDQPGFLLLLGVYDEAPPPLTAPARRRHVIGMLVAAFEAEQMLTQALELPTSLNLTVYDAGRTTDEPQAPTEERWLVGEPGSVEGPSVDVNIGDRRWRLQAQRLLPAERAGVYATLLSGLALTALVAGVLASVVASRRRAVVLAATMTKSLRESEERLRELNADLIEADRVKDEFLGNVSHELRTPLTAIAGISDLLNRRGDRLEAEQSQDLLHRLAGNVVTLRGLIDDLLDFTRLTGEDLPAPVPVDVQALATEVVGQLATFLSSHEVRVEDGPPAPALAVPQDVSRILHNLLANAVKYTPPGSHVVVRTATDGAAVQLVVADDGPGIPPEDAERVFERFQRGSGDEVLRRPGTGIGLAVVRELSRRLGGDATLSRTPGGGATFAVRLPRVPDSL